MAPRARKGSRFCFVRFRQDLSLESNKSTKELFDTQSSAAACAHAIFQEKEAMATHQNRRFAGNGASQKHPSANRGTYNAAISSDPRDMDPYQGE